MGLFLSRTVFNVMTYLMFVGYSLGHDLGHSSSMLLFIILLCLRRAYHFESTSSRPIHDWSMLCESSCAKGALLETVLGSY